MFANFGEECISELRKINRYASDNECHFGHQANEKEGYLSAKTASDPPTKNKTLPHHL